ncbi:hypothetical protein KUTeg_015409 [Tegillarca granosa]|uniref:Uncharacterized protein n=1 Tax=Tegillarca granosa TaxID=220873 RepID=A0ABQ9EQ87_TEGGR|nr:hypothetical protein KUTeg_015409 [Tegillarca granosa]
MVTKVMAIPATVVYFTTYEQIKLLLGYRVGVTSDNWYLPIIAGATARTGAVIFISPLEMVRTKMQSEQLSNTQIQEAVRKTIAQGGFRAMYKGLGPTLLRDVPFSGKSVN